MYSLSIELRFMCHILKVMSQVKHWRRNSPMLRVAAIVLLAASCSFAQSGRPVSQAGDETSENETIRIRTEEILVPVSIRDSSGAFVSGLSPDRFLIFDNGERQEIASLNRERIPANIVLLLDASGSVFNRMRFIREAAKRFLKSLLPEDKVCVMQFADNAELLQDWTAGTNSKPLLKALEWRYHPGQATVFYDGLYLAAQEQLSHVEGRRIVILLTDGIDSAEHKRASFSDALYAIRRSEASVYVISLTESLRADIVRSDRGWVGRVFGGSDPRAVARANTILDEAERLLTTVATETGGRIFFPIKEEDLLPAYESIADELRSQYILTFKPKKRAAAGEYRRIKVLVTPGGYEVAARDGYVGRS